MEQNTPARLPTAEQVYEILSHICDPEVPVLSILDLGIVRNVFIQPTSPQSGTGPTGQRGIDPTIQPINQSTDQPSVTITITPTYSGCPAMDVIGMQIRMALAGRGFFRINIDLQLSPAWTTAWMSEAGRQKLKAYGIAPPQYQDKEPALFEEESVPCPRCSSARTTLVSQYGATSCKSMYQCLACKEPFEHFKCH